jgi:hypothetical protein
MKIHSDVSIVRRHTGGGTVYQDLGNICYTFLLPRSLYDRERNSNIVVRALHQLGFAGAAQRGRNDIVVDVDDAAGETVCVASDFWFFLVFLVFFFCFFFLFFFFVPLTNKNKNKYE